MERCTGISHLVGRYASFAVDQWGCVHDGTSLYDGASTALERLVKADRRVILVSNSSRSERVSIRLLDRLGLPRSAYHGIVTAGELALRWIRARQEPMRALPLLGPPGPDSVIRELDLPTTDDPDDADVLIAAGVTRDAPDSRDAVLRHAQSRGLPLLCLNPDRVSISANGTTWTCPGAFADRYRELGGRCRSWGKPEQAMYQALGHGPGLGVGDSLDHDMLGAQRAGLDSLWITRGIHWEEVARHPTEPPNITRAAALARQHGVTPTWVAPTLRW